MDHAPDSNNKAGTTASIRRLMFNGVIWSGVGKLLSMAAKFITTLLLAHSLSPGEYGIYFVVLSTIVIMASVSSLGMDQIVVRFASVYMIKRDHVGINDLTMRCLIGVSVMAVVVCIMFWWAGPTFYIRVLNLPNVISQIWIIGIWIFFATIQRQIAETFRGLNDIRCATLFGGLRNSGIINASVACVAMLVLWVMGNLTLHTAIMAMLAVSIMVVIAGGTVLWRRLASLNIKYRDVVPERSESVSVRRILHEGWPLWLAVLVTVLNSMGGPWLAGAVDTPSHIALLGVAQRFVLLLTAPVAIVNAVLPPIVSQLYASGEKIRLQRVMRTASGLLLLPAAAIFISLVLFGKPLLDILFGSYYQAAYIILLLLCLGRLVNIACGSWNVVLSMTGGRYQLIACSAIMLGVQTVLALMIGSYLGVMGVAIGICAASILSTMVGIYFVHERLNIWIHASLSWATIKDVKGMVTSRLRRMAA